MNQRDAHESYKVAAGNLHWAILGLLGTLLLIVVLMYWLAKPLMQSAAALRVPPRPPAPRLQADPGRDLAALRAREQAKLDGYAWADNDHSFAQIPVSRAMQLLAHDKASR